MMYVMDMRSVFFEIGWKTLNTILIYFSFQSMKLYNL